MKHFLISASMIMTFTTVTYAETDVDLAIYSDEFALGTYEINPDRFAAFGVNTPHFIHMTIPHYESRSAPAGNISHNAPTAPKNKQQDNATYPIIINVPDKGVADFTSSAPNPGSLGLLGLGLVAVSYLLGRRPIPEKAQASTAMQWGHFWKF